MSVPAPDWKSLAKARQLNIPDEALERVSGPLDGLERAFRPLVATILDEVEPAIIFHASEEGA
jgi:hypothetical protein